MPPKSKNISPILLVMTALLGTGILFSLFRDPEGPNLVVTIGTALIIYVLSLTAYWFDRSATGLKKFFFAVLIQILVVVILYFCLK